MTLRGLLDDLYAPLRGIDGRTVELYGYTLRSFGVHLGHEPTLADLEELAVAKFLAARLRERSVATAAKDRAQLRALWEFAARRGLVTTWPQMRTIRVPERVPEAWLTDEFRRLLAAAGEECGDVGDVPAAAFWRSLLLLGYEVGERIGGLLSLEWRDVTPTGVVFRAETRKGKRRDIYRPISPECYQALDAIRTDRRLVYDWDRCYSLLWYRLGRICKRAGLPADRRSKFHRIRKTTASYAAAGGLDPQALLDHASATTTRKYLDPRIVRQASAPDVLPKVS